MSRNPCDARVLIYDIETAPNLGYTWGKWQQDVIAFEQEWYVLSFSWKWLGSKETYCVSLPDFPLYDTDPTNDLEVVTVIRDTFDEAEVTITHNGKAFDRPKAQSRMLLHKLDPPSPYREVDTLKVARREFAFNSNRLGDLCKAMGLLHKTDPGGFKTWLGCLGGDAAAWDRMTRYNKRDVVILERLYNRMLAWIPNHPNMAVITDRPEACPRCGRESTMVSNGWKTNLVSRRRSYKCTACGGFCLGRAAEQTSPTYVPA